MRGTSGEITIPVEAELEERIGDVERLLGKTVDRKRLALDALDYYLTRVEWEFVDEARRQFDETGAVEIDAEQLAKLLGGGGWPS